MWTGLSITGSQTNVLKSGNKVVEGGSSQLSGGEFAGGGGVQNVENHTEGMSLYQYSGAPI